MAGKITKYGKQTEIPAPKYKCLHCGKATGRKADNLVHLFAMHQEYMYTCLFCLQHNQLEVFDNRNELGRHMRTSPVHHTRTGALHQMLSDVREESVTQHLRIAEMNSGDSVGKKVGRFFFKCLYEYVCMYVCICTYI